MIWKKRMNKQRVHYLRLSLHSIALAGILFFSIGTGNILSVQADGSTPGTHTITHFQGNQPAAITISFDDGYTSQVTVGAAQLTARGLKGTFFVITNPGWISGHVSWATWQDVADQGHEIASHTVNHYYPLTTYPESTVRLEFSTSRSDIDAHISGQSALTIAYPGTISNAFVQAIASDYYVAGRGGWAKEGGYINYYDSGSDPYGTWSPVNFYDVGSMDMDGLDMNDADFNSRLDRALLRNGWFLIHFHEIPDINTYENILDYIQGKQGYWIDTFSNVARYMKERLNSTIQVTTHTESEIRLQIVMDASLPTSIYNVPLTIRSTVPASWSQVIIQQGSSSQTVAPEVEGSEKVVYYDALPNGGDIVLRQPNPVPGTTNLNPASAFVGGSSFTLTVNGNNFVAGSIIRWNNADRTTTFINSMQLTASIPASDIASIGTANITVFNPSPGGGTSTQLPFTISQIPCYTLQVIPDPGYAGSVSVDPLPNCANNKYLTGTMVSISASGNQGYFFSNWGGDASGATNPESITVDGDKVVSAAFVTIPPVCYALTLGHTGNGTDPAASPTSSTGCSAGQYVAGETISLSGAVPDVGWQIIGWTNTDDDTSKAATNSVTMPASALTATANYIPVIVPVPISPMGAVNGVAKPNFVWSVFPGAISYKLAVWSDSALAYVVQEIVPTSACNAGQCSFQSPINLANGGYKFKVLANLSGGATPYSEWMPFTITGVIIPPPTTPPALIAPDTMVNTHRPTFHWAAVTDATFYRLAVYSYATLSYVFVENVYPSCVAGVCSYTPSAWDLPNGSYGFKLRSRNSSGYTAFGAMMNFSVSSDLPVAPTLLAPTGTVSTARPEFRWGVVSGATKYRLLVYSIASGTYAINAYVYPTACAGAICTYVPPSDLVSGGYKFKMAAYNTYGASGYSAYKSFTVP